MKFGNARAARPHTGLAARADIVYLEKVEGGVTRLAGRPRSAAGSRPSTGSRPAAPRVRSGRATVLRDGKVFQTRWQRSSPEGGTAFTLSDGRRMPFARGQVRVVHADR